MNSANDKLLEAVRRSTATSNAQRAREAVAVDGPAPLSGNDDAIAFADDFFGDGPRQLLAVKKGSGQMIARTFDAADIAGQRKFIADQQAAGRDIYFPPNPHKTRLDKKGTKGDVAEARWLWIDLDPRKKEPLDAERPKMLALLTSQLPAGIPKPNRVIDSGRGYWGFWKLATPQPVDGMDGTLTAAVESYGRGIERAFGDRFADGCRNIDRIARLAGTVNQKTGQIARVLHEFSHDEPHEIESFPRATDKAMVARIDSKPEGERANAAPVSGRPRIGFNVAAARELVGTFNVDSLRARGVEAHAILSLQNGDDLSLLAENHAAIGHRVTEGQYKSHSEVTFAIAGALSRAGFTPDEAAAVLGDKQFPGNQHVTRQKPVAARRAIGRAIAAEHYDVIGEQRRAAATEEGIPKWRDCDDKYGLEPLPTLRNTVIGIEALGIGCRHDIFHESILVEYGGEQDQIRRLVGELTDHCLGAIRSCIDKRYRIDMGDANVYAAVREIARDHAFHPVRDYLDECQPKWNGVERLDKLAVTHFGAEDTPLNRAQFRKVFIASVRRIRQPGVKFDNILVLESEEGTGKSTAVEILYGTENFSDQTLLGLGDREVQERLAGVWGFEIAELAGMSRAEVERIKAQTTRTVDRARPAYGRVTEKRPRTCVMWASTNNQNYLKSQTGNRRFWPVEIGSIDLDALRRDRDQIWAEAAMLEASGESLLLDKTLWADATAAQEQRREVDPWEDILANIPETVKNYYGTEDIHILFTQDAGDRREIRVSAGAILTHILRVPPKEQHGAMGTRLATVMKRLGWQRPDHRKVRVDGEAVSGFWREDLRNLTSGAAGDVDGYVQTTLPGISRGAAQ